MNWRTMETAPQDGTWIVGRDKSGAEATIQSRPVHPLVPDSKHWAVGDPVQEGNWITSTCFYPTEWHPVEGDQP